MNAEPPPDILFDGPATARRTIVLAHGAGVGMDSPFMAAMAKGLADRGFRVARFEFPYMAGRRTGKKRPPDREPALRAAWLRVIAELGADSLVIGGKSMGGRIATLIADEAKVAGLVCLGYPFHPVGKPKQLRVEHLRTIKTPTLILQGPATRSVPRRKWRAIALGRKSKSAGFKTETIVSSRAGPQG